MEEHGLVVGGLPVFVPEPDPRLHGLNVSELHAAHEPVLVDSKFWRKVELGCIERAAFAFGLDVGLTYVRVFAHVSLVLLVDGDAGFKLVVLEGFGQEWVLESGADDFEVEHHGQNVYDDKPGNGARPGEDGADLWVEHGEEERHK